MKSITFIFICIFFHAHCLLKDYMSFFLYQTHPSAILLRQKTDENTCATWQIFRGEFTEDFYRHMIACKEEAAFYHMDEEKKQWFIQKNMAENNFLVVYIFKIKSHYYEIRLSSCKRHLPSNKAKLESISQQLLAGDELHDIL